MTPNEEETAQDQATGVENDNGEEKQALSLEVSVESPSTCQRHVTVTISREDVDRYFDQAFSELMPTANVPGFRPGRAPRKLVESRFRKEMEEQVKSSLLMDTMSQVTEEQEFSAISEPDFDFERNQAQTLHNLSLYHGPGRICVYLLNKCGFDTAPSEPHPNYL